MLHLARRQRAYGPLTASAIGAWGLSFDPAEVLSRVMELTTLLKELEPTVEDNLNRHLDVAQEWMPHEYVPWSDGRNFALLDGEAWSVEQSTLSPIARTALEVNLLTEDNLPSYHREVE